MKVPVDRVTIRNGPSMAEILRLHDSIESDEVDRPSVRFTLTTPASLKIFKRSISLRSIKLVDDYTFGFVADTPNGSIKGQYNPRVRGGYFEFDD